MMVDTFEDVCPVDRDSGCVVSGIGDKTRMVDEVPLPQEMDT